MPDYNHVDMLGNKVDVHDLVVAYGTITGGHPSFPRHGMMFGKVIKLSPKTVLIKCFKITGEEKDQVRIQNFSQVAVVNDQMLKALMKKRLETS